MRERTFVVEVIDGDTFLDDRNERYRLANVDAPELNTELGKEAKAELTRLIANRHIEYEEKARDDYGRIVAEVWVAGINVNATMKRFLQS